MVTIPLLLNCVADFVWRHGRESNPSWSDRQSVALPESYRGIFLFPVGTAPTIYCEHLHSLVNSLLTGFALEL